MKLISTILFLLFAWVSSIAFATKDDTKNDKIIKSSRDFSLRYRSLDTNDSPEQQIAVKVFAEYSSKDQTILINIDSTTENKNQKPFMLNYPLDFDVFKQRFDSLLSKNKGNPFSVSYGSQLEVFYWIVTITEDSNLPLAGVLTTSQYVMISSNSNHKDYTERVTAVKSEVDKLVRIQAKLKNATDQKKDIEKHEKDYKKFRDSITHLFSGSGSKKDTLQRLILLKKYAVVKNYFDSQIAKDSIYLPTINSLIESRKPIGAQINNEITQAEDELKVELEEIENLNIRKVSHVQYQFEKGYLEKIQVYIESPQTGNLEIFENSYPIGFSSISNYRNFTSTRLFRRSSKFETDVKDNYILLSDIIKLYENELNLATRDYSPGDTTITVFPGSNPIVRLTKQRSFYIIDGKTFTDVTGLSEDSPNGLVQVELSRRFNLWTHRYQVRSSNNYGFVNYVNAKVNFSKIENKLKGLPLRNQLIVENNSIVSPSYATNLDYLRYENLGITLDVNTFLFDAPDFKYTLFIDAGIHYGHTPIIDSIYEISQGVASTTSQEPNSLDAHNFTFFPRVKVQLFAERRYGLSLSYQANYTWLFTNNRFKQVVSYSGKGQDLNSLSTNQMAHWSHMIEASFYVDVNPASSTGKIFTTARFFFQQGDVNTFYPQILLGYAFNIFK